MAFRHSMHRRSNTTHIIKTPKPGGGYVYFCECKREMIQDAVAAAKDRQRDNGYELLKSEQFWTCSSGIRDKCESVIWFDELDSLEIEEGPTPMRSSQPHLPQAYTPPRKKHLGYTDDSTCSRFYSKETIPRTPKTQEKITKFITSPQIRMQQSPKGLFSSKRSRSSTPEDDNIRGAAESSRARKTRKTRSDDVNKSLRVVSPGFVNRGPCEQQLISTCSPRRDSSRSESPSAAVRRRRNLPDEENRQWLFDGFGDDE